MHLRRPAIVFALIALFATMALSGPLTAQAGTRSFSGQRLGQSSVVFKVRGVSPTAVRAARLKSGRYSRRLRVSMVRRGVRRGRLRVWAPRRILRRLRSAQGRRHSHGPARASKRAKLVVRYAAPRESAPRPSAPTVHRPATPCQVPGDARYVSSTGSDSAPGSATEPWRTLDRALEQSAPGQTVVLRPGTYGQRGTVTHVRTSGTASAPISIVSEPGAEKPTILGQFRVSADHVKVCGLLFDGPTGPIPNGTASSKGGEDVQLFVYGDGFELTGSEVRNNAWHAGVYLYDADDARLVGNHIHDNGDFSDPAQANLDHGIYWDSGSGLVADNVIEHNRAYGVHLYPSTRGVTVTRNTITRHGKGGVILAEQAADNTIVDNTITDNREGIRTWNLTGTGNVARDNRVWGNPGGDLVSVAGLALDGNRAG